MPTDAEKWRFLADHSLVLNRSTDGVSIMYYKPAENAGLAPRFSSVATGKDADEAINNAIARWKKKHNK